MPHVRTLLMAVLTACCGLAFAQQAAPMNAEQRKEARTQIALERKASEERLALVLGTEGDGLASSTIANCDYTVRIPMAHGVDSLNVAAASAVAFWELRAR